MKLSLKKILLATILCSTTTLSYGMEATQEAHQQFMRSQQQQMSRATQYPTLQARRSIKISTSRYHFLSHENFVPLLTQEINEFLNARSMLNNHNRMLIQVLAENYQSPLCIIQPNYIPLPVRYKLSPIFREHKLQGAQVVGAQIPQCQQISFKEYKKELFKQKKKEMLDYYISLSNLDITQSIVMSDLIDIVKNSHSIADILKTPMVNFIIDNPLITLLQISDKMDHKINSLDLPDHLKNSREKNKDCLKLLSLINYPELEMDVFNLGFSPLTKTELKKFLRLKENSKNETLKKIMDNMYILNPLKFSSSMKEGSKEYFLEHNKKDNDSKQYLVAPKITFIMLMIDDNILDQQTGYTNWKYLDANFSSFFPFSNEQIKTELKKNYKLTLDKNDLEWYVEKNELSKGQKKTLKKEREKDKIKSPLFFNFIGSKIPKDEKEYLEISKIAKTPKEVLKKQLEELAQKAMEKELEPSKSSIEQRMGDLRLEPTVEPELKLEHTIGKQQDEEVKSSLEDVAMEEEDGAVATQEKQSFYKQENGKTFYTKKDYLVYQSKKNNLEEQQKIVKALTMQKVHKYQLINETRQLGAEERDIALEKLNTTPSTKQSIQDLFTGTYAETKMAPKELCELYGDLQLSKRIGRTSGTHAHIQIASTIGMQMVSHGSYGDKYYGKKTMSDIKQKINFILHQALYPN